MVFALVGAETDGLEWFWDLSVGQYQGSSKAAPAGPRQYEGSTKGAPKAVPKQHQGSTKAVPRQ